MLWWWLAWWVCFQHKACLFPSIWLLVHNNLGPSTEGSWCGLRCNIDLVLIFLIWNCNFQNSDSYQESSATLSMASKSRQVVNRLQVEYQGDANDQKLDMEAKLKAWRESKNRTPRRPVTINPSPLCAKTPSASKAAAAPKRAAMSVPNAGNPKPR